MSDGSRPTSSARHAAAATEAGVELSAVAGPPIELDADPVRLREVLANLVVNGVRHTPAGGSVRLDARVDGAWVELTVTDTGEGIAPADLERIFDRFHRRAGGRADTGRSGLGLTIVRDLVAAHGGTVHAESRRHRRPRFDLPGPPPPPRLGRRHVRDRIRDAPQPRDDAGRARHRIHEEPVAHVGSWQ